MDTDTTQNVHHLARPEGRVSYTVEGSGPLVIAIPGMGDLRSSYRELVAPLLAAGYRVAVMDLRGHGASDTTFRTHGDIATGQDLLALIGELGAPAVVLGNSMGAASAAWAAAEDPRAIAGLVFYGPLLRDAPSSSFARAATRGFYRIALVRPWGAAFWAGFYRSINKGTRAPWLEEHVAAIRSMLAEPGRLRSFRQLALQLDHSVVEKRLGEVTAPMLAFVGTLDPDYPSPAAESEWISSLGGRSRLVEDAGHYPHAQRPDITVPGTLDFLNTLRGGSTGEWASRA
jgi:pimeloyl-ACP methyl ester carboxylesterase